MALGGNLFSLSGSPSETLRKALRDLQDDDLHIRAVSRFWRSPAVPAGSGPDYVNAAAMLESPLPPADLLERLHRVEAGLGRRRDGGRWQPRGIDLDLIAVGDAVLPDAATQDVWRGLAPDDQARVAPDQLILPHPRMQDRGFVLAPLAEIAPGWVHPRTKRTVAAMLAALDPAEFASIAPIPVRRSGGKGCPA